MKIFGRKIKIDSENPTFNKNGMYSFRAQYVESGNFKFNGSGNAQARRKKQEERLNKKRLEKISKLEKQIKN